MDNLIRLAPDAVPVGADNHTGCLVLLQEGDVDAITGDDTVLAGLAAQDPYAVVLDEPAFTEEPYGIGVAPDQVDLVRFVNAVLEKERRRRFVGGQLPALAAADPGQVPGSADAAVRPDAAAMSPVHAPDAPGRLGQPVEVMAMQTYLTALDQWVRFRKDELDELDAAALSSPRKDELTDDMTLSMALWKAVADRQQLLLAVWDGGRVLVAERERLATLVWGRLDATLDAAVVAKGTKATRPARWPSRSPRPAGSPTPSPGSCASDSRSTRPPTRTPPGSRSCAQPSNGCVTRSGSSPTAADPGPSTPGTSWPRASRTSPTASSVGATSAGCSGPSRTRPPASSATSSSAAPSGATPATGPPQRPSCATTCWPARLRSASSPSGASRRSTRRPSTPCPTSRRSARCRTRRSSSRRTASGWRGWATR